MKVEKLSISLEASLGEHIQSAAERAGLSVSAWIARAAAAELRREALGAFLADWQHEHGRITAAELARARGELGFPPVRGRS